MKEHTIYTGDLIDEVNLTLEELANSCNVDKTWVIQRVNSGSLTFTKEEEHWQFSSHDLIRAKRLLAIEQNFEANEELAALVADLIEELASLRKQIEISGFHIS
jgi:chaperone modulatory protein CbpM